MFADFADLHEWLCVGQSCWEATVILTGVMASASLAHIAFPRQVLLDRWIRYRIDLATAPPPPPEVRLTPVTDQIIAALREGPDRAENQLRSGFRFWDHGLRRAYLWTGEEGPLCVQWLLTGPDNPKLRTLPEWAGMYPPLLPDCGQVENLFAFSNVRRRGVATLFEQALYQEARRAGLRRLVTHIHEGNIPAQAWADRTGWHRYGDITRYRLDWARLHAPIVCVHRNDDGT